MSDSLHSAQLIMSRIAEDLQRLPLHGGDITHAADRFGIPESKWLDLSTGINPEAYPVPEIPSQVFQRLPVQQPEWLEAIQHYYCPHNKTLTKDNVLAVPGTQAAIQWLPQVLSALNDAATPAVLVPEVGYQEHRRHWQVQGATPQCYPDLTADAMIAFIDKALQQQARQHLVIVNPNNPTGVTLDAAQINRWAEQLAPGFFVVVDEAFMDMTPDHSMLDQETLPDNVLVLRSFGKFFGLAGIRLGFVFGAPHVLQALEKYLGIWSVNGVAAYLATCALQDHGWQQQARAHIIENAKFTRQLCAPLFEKASKSHLQQQPLYAADTALFTTYQMPLVAASSRYHEWASHGVLTRLFPLDDGRALLRVGHLSKNNKAGIEQFNNCLKRTAE